MTTTNTTTACERLREELAALADDETAAVDEHGEHLGGCDECRDARHEARAVARAIATAGDEYEPADDFHERLMRAVDLGLAAARTAAVPGTTASRPRVEPASAERPRATTDSKVVPLRRWVAIALSCAAALTAVALGARALWSPTAGTPASAPVAPWTARVETIVRSGEEPGVTGLQLRASAEAVPSAAAAGATAPAGSLVATDARTRARLVLSDGTVLVLDHDTAIALDPSAPRGVRLERGVVVADVAHLSSGPHASFSTARATIEVLGTKFVLTATDERTSIEVVRGAVRVVPQGRAGAAEVQAGQEGVVAATGKPRVMPATHLASAVQWSELDAPESGEPLGSSGLGVLRARQPGQPESSEHPLSLALHRVSVRIAGTVARTEIEERFANDGPRVLEGTYEFPLPSDARIVRLALDVDGRLVDGAIVERDRATKIWAGVIRHATPVAQRERKEEFVWVPGPWRDPALLEWRAGGRFGLRIFPIPAHGERRVVLAYEQVIAPHGDERRYVYPLPHPVGDQARAGRFEMDARVVGADPDVPVTVRGYPARVGRDGEARRVQFTEDRFVPAGDFVLDWSLPHRDAELRSWTYAQDDDAWALVALRPRLPAWTESRRQDVAIVVDASQSMFGEQFRRAGELAAAVVAEMDRRDHFTVLACDVRCQAMPGGRQAPSAEAAGAVRAWLQTIEPAGASDLGAALRTAAHAIEGDGTVQVVYVGDGTATVGHRRTAALEAEVASLRPAVTVTTVGIGGEADETMLAALARAGGGQFVAYRPTDALSSAALAVVEATIGPSLQDPTLELPAGLDEVAPASLPTIRAGQEVVIAARLTGPVQGEAVLRGRVGGAPFERRYPLRLEPASSGGNAFVPAVWAERRIADLDRSDAPDAIDRIVTLSKRYGVVSRHTSLLVLESEAMFRAFGVEHEAPVASWNGEDDPVASEVAALEPSDDGLRTKGLNVSRQHRPRGEAEGGGSAFARNGAALEQTMSGAGREVRGQVASPGARFAEAVGSLDTGGVQRVLRAHLGEIRALYERSLRTDPQASGRTVATITIAPSGAVANVQVSGGPIDSEAMASVIRRWRFPPTQGPVTVSYPFVFAPGDGGARVGRGARPATDPPAPRDPQPDHAVVDEAARRTNETATATEALSARLSEVRGRPRVGGGRWMRRTFRRAATVLPDGASRPAEQTAVERDEAALAERPDSRDRHEALVRALARVGLVDRALEVAGKWRGRDPLDPDAILALADALARLGRRDESLRMLSGVVDVRPDDRALHERLAGAYERAGDGPLACAHRVTIAELAPDDAGAIGAAVRCEKQDGRADVADRLLARIGDERLRELARTAAAESPVPPRPSGDLTIDASWDGDEDLDVALITSGGTRVSWMGGRKAVAAEDAAEAGHERLGLRFAPAGSYRVEIARTVPGAEGLVRGRLQIQALGTRRTVEFVLDGARTTVARVDVTRREVLVPAN